MIRLENLSAGYFGKPVIENVTMEFEPGKVTVLVGPNGSGKSTLLKAALGLLPAMGGKVLYDETDIRLLKRGQIARKAAFLTQSRNTPSIRALQMVLHGRFPYLSYPRYYGREDYEVARRAMDTTGSRQHENANLTRLSGGQRQGVYLAMSLAQDTRTIFMDEPATYLDISHQFRLMRTAKSLAREGKAVVLVSHDISLALREGDAVGVFGEGKLLCFDTPDSVYRKGVIEQAFNVGIHRVDTPHGTQYYCTPKEAKDALVSHIY